MACRADAPEGACAANGYVEVIRDQTARSLWSLRNVLEAIPDAWWTRRYCGAPLWKHVYHTLHSLDRWYINPFAYTEPSFHTEGLNDLDADTGDAVLSRETLRAYANQVEQKIHRYLQQLEDAQLLEQPVNGERFTRFHFILAQHRHLDMHIGMLMGYIIADTGRWPRVLGLMDAWPEAEGPLYF